MGTIEVYDYKNKRWDLYVPNFEKWEHHFSDVREKRARPDHRGRYVVGSGAKRLHTSTVSEPQVKLVTPVAQAVEMAESELRREKDSDQDTQPSTTLKKVIRKRQKVSKPKNKKSKNKKSSQLD
ncbi:hypothetical protein KUTeg_014620 [Tegillarca granosa]|uniref:Uncharacterized protein n=1 Tax=Tegillarca granosa TaxID=220873 RepID=A0ABQ9ERJ0_TEGGR|nr:hypothetical protein KUTeg_014620 [Tegillarca granosa]